MRIIAMGTGPFAVPSFVELVRSAHDVVAFITRPVLKPSKRTKQIPNPMRAEADQHAVEVIDPPNVNDPVIVERLASMDADLFFVCDYGQILSAECLSATRLGGINLHGSLLPKYRGAAPVNWAIYHGESTTGVSVIHMTPRLDAGPTIVQRQLEIDDHETAEALESRLAELGVAAVCESIDILARWDGTSPIGTPQDPAQASSARRLRKSDGAIDWTRSAEQIRNQVRAFQPWPSSFCFWYRQSGDPMRITLHAVRSVADWPAGDTPTVDPGSVAEVSRQQILVATGHGAIAIEWLQPAGKRVMTTEEFLRGYALKVGDRLGG